MVLFLPRSDKKNANESSDRSSTTETTTRTYKKPLPLKQRTSSVDTRRDYSAQTWWSVLGLLKAREYFITVDHFSIWRRHLAWAMEEGKDLKSYMTQRYASSMVFMSLLLSTELAVLFNSAGVTSEVRHELHAENYTSVSFWIGMTILLSALLTLLSLLSTFTAWAMVSAVDETNAHCIFRSSIGQYVAELPGRFIVYSIYSFMLWVMMFLFVLLPFGYWSMALLCFALVLFVKVVTAFSAFGRIIMHTGAMGSQRIFDPSYERVLLPHGLHTQLLTKARANLANHFSITRQYRGKTNKPLDRHYSDDELSARLSERDATTRRTRTNKTCGAARDPDDALNNNATAATTGWNTTQQTEATNTSTNRKQSDSAVRFADTVFVDQSWGGGQSGGDHPETPFSQLTLTSRSPSQSPIGERSILKTSPLSNGHAHVNGLMNGNSNGNVNGNVNGNGNRHTSDQQRQTKPPQERPSPILTNFTQSTQGKSESRSPVLADQTRGQSSPTLEVAPPSERNKNASSGGQSGRTKSCRPPRAERSSSSKYKQSHKIFTANGRTSDCSLDGIEKWLQASPTPVEGPNSRMQSPYSNQMSHMQEREHLHNFSSWKATTPSSTGSYIGVDQATSFPATPSTDATERRATSSPQESFTEEDNKQEKILPKPWPSPLGCLDREISSLTDHVNFDIEYGDIVVENFQTTSTLTLDLECNNGGYSQGSQGQHLGQHYRNSHVKYDKDNNIDITNDRDKVTTIYDYGDEEESSSLLTNGKSKTTNYLSVDEKKHDETNASTKQRV